MKSSRKAEQQVDNKIGKFIISVDDCRNSTWQGKIVCANKNITHNFNSALDLVKLIDNSLEEIDNISQK